MTRTVDERPTASAVLLDTAGHPSEPDADGPADGPPESPEGGEPEDGGKKGDRPSERPMATGRLDVPSGFPFEGDAHILVLAASAERRDATVELLRRDGDAGWDVDAAGTCETVRAKLALETFAVVVLFADHEDLAPREVIRVIESTRRWPSPAVVVVLGENAPDCEPGEAAAEDMGAFRLLTAESSGADLVEAVRAGVRRDAVRARPRWETDPGP